VVGEVAAGQPVLPMVRRPRQAFVGVLVVFRRRPAAPGQRAEPGVPFPQQRPPARRRPLDAEPDVGGEGYLHRVLGGGNRLVVVRVGTAPVSPLISVAEHGLAVQRQLHGTLYAPHRAEQDVLGVVVGRRPDVLGVSRVLVPPGPYHQAVAHDDPALAAVPARLQHHRPGQVPPVGRHLDILRAEPERARAPVQDGTEQAGAVHPGQAHPFDGPAGRDQRSHLAVGQEAIVRDRRVGRELPGSADQPQVRQLRLGQLRLGQLRLAHRPLVIRAPCVCCRHVR
jgi:hypothetical protein